MVNDQVIYGICLLKYFHKEDNTKAMASQLFYRISWPHVSSPSELIESNKEHLSNYSESSKKIVVLTSIKTSLPKTTTGCGKLVELYLTMASPLQVICLIEMPN